MMYQIWKQSHIGDESHPEYPLGEILLIKGLTYEQSVVLCKEVFDSLYYSTNGDNCCKAITQMAGKGVVLAEEYIAQLCGNFPAVYSPAMEEYIANSGELPFKVFIQWFHVQTKSLGAIYD